LTTSTADLARAVLEGVALGDVDRADLRSLVPLDATVEPDLAHRAVYDRLYAEFPRLYRSQRRMFHRLHRPH
jgi:xylulokinase